MLEKVDQKGGDSMGDHGISLDANSIVGVDARRWLR